MSGNYRALTRRYRPSTFEDIVSQQHVSNTLKNAIEKDRIAHAYMFCGPRGVGKTTMARVLARTINDVAADVDGEALGNTLNIIEIDAASNNKVEDVHRIRETVRIPPQNGRFKVYIIDEVHMLSKSAFNALLKTLEEPPSHAIFIFATTEPHKVLPTILSRVQRFDFRRIKVEEIVEHLRQVAHEESITIDEESLHVIAKKADGALRDALGLLDQAIAFCGDIITHEALLNALNVVGTERLFELTTIISDKDAKNGMLLFDQLLQEGHDMQEFLVSLTEHFRNMYMAIDGNNLHLIEASDETRNRYKNEVKTFSSQDILRYMHLVAEAQVNIKDAHQPRILCEITLLKLITMERVSGLEVLLKELGELKKKISSNGLTSQTVQQKEETTPPKSTATYSASASRQDGSSGRTSEPSAQLKDVGSSLFSDVNPAIKPAIKRKDPSAKLRAVPRDDIHDQKNDQPDDEVVYGRIDGNLALAPSPKLADTAVMEADGFSENDTSVKETANESNKNADNIYVKSGDEQNEDDNWLESGRFIELDEVESVWDRFLEISKSHLNETMCVFLSRCRPNSVKENTIYIEVSDPLGETIISTHKRTLGICFNEIFDSRVQVESIFIRNKNEEENLDIYERFKQLQKKDPKIKRIIELFGAELVY